MDYENKVTKVGAKIVLTLNNGDIYKGLFGKIDAGIWGRKRKPELTVTLHEIEGHINNTTMAIPFCIIRSVHLA